MQEAFSGCVYETTGCEAYGQERKGNGLLADLRILPTVGVDAVSGEVS